MNINKGTEVYVIYKYGDENEWYSYRKEKFVQYQNSYPVCTVDMRDGVHMGYEEICLTEKEAKSRINRLENNQKKMVIKNKYYILFNVKEDKYYVRKNNGYDNIGYTITDYKATKFLSKSDAFEFKKELETKTNNEYIVCEVSLNITKLIND